MMQRLYVLTFVVLILAILGGAVLLLTTRPEPIEIVINPPVPTPTLGPTDTPGPIVVYVSGAVNNPQVTLELSAGSRVQDALEAAGGVADNADLARVNLAGILRDGDQVHVFPKDEIIDEVIIATPSGGGLVFINRATLDELIALPEIGATTAANIIAYREENGPITSFEDLDQVSGIGPATIEQLQGLVSFEP